MRSLAAKISRLQLFERLPGRVVVICAGLESLDRVHNQVELVEIFSARRTEISRDAARGPVENRRELCEGDRIPPELASRTPPQDHVLQRVARDLIIWQRPQGHGVPCTSRAAGPP